MIGVGKLETLKSTTQWKIEHFSSIDVSLGVPVISPMFHTTNLHTNKFAWQLRFYPGGFDAEYTEHMGLFLRYLGETSVSVAYSISILDNKHKKVAEFSLDEKSFKKNLSWGISTLCLKTLVHDETKHVLVNDTLLIACTITVKNTMLDNEHYDPDDSARVYFGQLLESGDLSDITFKIENKQMRLHKTIIASLSPVFLAMFQHQMKEKEENVVQITDVNYKVMKELFRYIYVRKVNHIKSIACDLLVAADKYDVQGLKLLCEDILFQNLDVNNALQNLELAIKYNTTFLKSKVTEYILSRLEEFVERSDFEQMDGCYKNELFRAIAKNKVKNVP